MRGSLNRIRKLLFDRENHGVPAPVIFTRYELKLLSALGVLALALLWALARHHVEEGIWGVALIGGLSIYLSYSKYYCTYKPAMDRWGICELACPHHPREEFRVADRDLLITEDEVAFIGRRYGVKIVHHSSPQNPAVEIYESERHYEHRLLADRFSVKH